MPSSIDTFALQRAKAGILRALRAISQEDGYNTSPVVQIGHQPLSKVPAGEMPNLCIEFADLQLDVEQLGGTSQGLLRMAWTTYVWGYVASHGHKDDLYTAGLALLADVYAAIYGSETLPDGAGQGSVLFVNPGSIEFDMESYSDSNRGYFLAEFQLVVDLVRGAQP